jgi:uncharacterized GH25 family protein
LAKRTILAGAAVALLLQVGAAAAHQVWLERDAGAAVARAYFGEPVENKREKTGALLDRIKGPKVFAADPKTAFPQQRRENHIEAALPAGTGDVRLVEDSLAVSQRAGNPERTKGIFLAREGRSETIAAMDLELVPVSAGGNDFVLMLKGKPLAKAEVTLVAPPRWQRALTTDEQGRVSFETPWAGRYVAEVIHIDPTPGGEGEGAYTRLRYVSTLSFLADKGIAWSDK